jgi:hypothetical protein
LKPLVRKKKRMLSRFLAQELLFDYVTDGLDRERREALEAYLPTCTETQRQLHNLKMGLEICGQLRRIQVSDPSIEAIANARSPVQKILHGLKPNHWPEYIQWSAEAILVAACLGGLVLFVPWQKISRILPKRPSDITLVEVKKQTEPLPNEPHPVESVKVAAETTAPSTPEPPANQEAEAPAQETETAAAEPPSPEDQKAPGPLEEDTQVAHQGPMKGVLYRAFMASDDSTDITREIRDIITALGGKKAGRVELGWRKPGGSYYHFTLPESNFDELQERLKALGPVRIAKEAHSRVMPAGKIRIILWVEEKSLAQ